MLGEWHEGAICFWEVQFGKDGWGELGFFATVDGV